MLPQFLKEGDMVAIVSPSGAIEPQLIDRCRARLESWGLRVKESAHSKGKYGSFSGTRAERLGDLQEAIDDQEVKAIVCSRGGYGLVQIVDGLDLSSFEVMPKWIVGFSDITALHSLCGAMGVASVHGIMAKHIGGLDENAEAVKKLKELLFGKLPTYEIPAHPLNRRGEVKGKLVGGNLALIQALRGTPYDLDVYSRDNVLFIEDVGERPYRIDRMMENLRLGGVLENLKGLVVGQFSDYEDDGAMMHTVEEGIAELVKDYDYPVIFNFPAGHVEDNRPLIMNANVELKVEEEKATVNFLCKQ